MEETKVIEEQKRQEIKRPVGVRFKTCGRMYVFDACDLEVQPGDAVVVESMFGLTIGRVVKMLEPEEVSPELREVKRVIRIATEDDFKKAEDNKALEEEAFKFCLERIEARGLPMKLVSTEATLDRRRIIFYFTADGRIDFRELVKDLAARFKTRIEMRQIGVRDEAKLLGGIGICGRVLCCNSFLSEFVPISIKMAKDQELVLNTSKLTGLCGRLMCCLSYEYEGRIEGEDEVIPEDLEGCLCKECPSTDVTMIKTVEPEEKERETREYPSQETLPEGVTKEEPKEERAEEKEVTKEQEETARKEQPRDRPSQRPYQKREPKKSSRDAGKRRHKKKRRHGRHIKKKRGKR